MSIQMLIEWAKVEDECNKVFEPTPLSPEMREKLKEIERRFEIDCFLMNLRSSIETLWVAVQSGEINQETLLDTLWGLRDQAELARQFYLAERGASNRLYWADAAASRMKKTS